MKRTRKAALPLKLKAIDSLKFAVSTFNGSAEVGRHTTVYLFLQHSCEMLLKACALQRDINIFKSNGQTITLYDCLTDHGGIFGLVEGDIGAIKIVDKARNDAQHYYSSTDESLVHIQVQAIIPIFDKLLFNEFGERLGDHIPDRVIPLSTIPVQGVDLILDTQLERIRSLLAPGTRRRDEARSVIRGIVSMEAYAADTPESVSEHEVDRVLKGIRDGDPVESLFPTLSALSVGRAAYGSKLAVRFTRHAEDGAVPFMYSPEGKDSVLVEEKDLSGKYNLTKKLMNEKLSLSNEKGKALRTHLHLENNPEFHRVEKHNNSTFDKYTPNALQAMKDFFTEGGNIDKVLADYRAKRPASG